MATSKPRTKPGSKIRVDGIAVNVGDYFALRGGIVTIEGDWMTPKMTRRGFYFCGKPMDRAKKMRELAKFLTDVAGLLEDPKVQAELNKPTPEVPSGTVQNGP